MLQSNREQQEPYELGYAATSREFWLRHSLEAVTAPAAAKIEFRLAMQEKTHAEASKSPQ